MRRQAPDLVEFGCQNELAETVMSTSTLIETPAAQDERATLFVGFELSRSSWLIGVYSPALGKTVSRYKVDGGDLAKVLELIAAMRRRLGKLGTRCCCTRRTSAPSSPPSRPRCIRPIRTKSEPFQCIRQLKRRKFRLDAPSRLSMHAL